MIDRYPNNKLTFIELELDAKKVPPAMVKFDGAIFMFQGVASDEEEALVHYYLPYPFNQAWPKLKFFEHLVEECESVARFGVQSHIDTGYITYNGYEYDNAGDGGMFNRGKKVNQ